MERWWGRTGAEAPLVGLLAMAALWDARLVSPGVVALLGAGALALGLRSAARTLARRRARRAPVGGRHCLLAQDAEIGWVVRPPGRARAWTTKRSGAGPMDRNG